MQENQEENIKSMTPLSASRISTYEGCSWLGFSSYDDSIFLPRSGNSGSAMGSIAHDLYEIIGKEKHKGAFDYVLKNKSFKGHKGLERLIRMKVRSDEYLGQEIHVDQIDNFIFNGLDYDFDGKKGGKLHESHDELAFDLTGSYGDAPYRIRGFIDKLFIYDKGKSAKIRDFKTSKSTYSKKEMKANIQSFFYALAISKLFPDVENIEAEFVFVKWHEDDRKENILIVESFPKERLLKFEKFLSEKQVYIDSLDEDSAQDNMAKDKGFLPPDAGFNGLIKCMPMCEYPGKLKKNGEPYYYCPAKFGFTYWVMTDKETGKAVRSSKVIEDFEDLDDSKYDLEERQYMGCPAWSNLEYNQDFKRSISE